VYQEKTAGGGITRHCKTCKDIHRGRTPRVYF
jgi:hypothetical protein